MENYRGFIMKWVRPQLDLVSAGVRNRPDVSQLSVVEFRCGKVENLGGRGVRVKKRGSNMCGGLCDLNDLLIFLTLCLMFLYNKCIIDISVIY